MQLSEHFTLEEFTRSQNASRQGIANIPPQDSIPAVRRLVDTVLERARSQLGKPMNINSGYRSAELNKLIGGSQTSQHMWTANWAAADVEVFGVDNVTLARWIEANCDFDQLICECYDPAVGPNSGWVHVSTRTDGQNRHESLTFQRAQGYSKGLPA